MRTGRRGIVAVLLAISLFLAACGAEPSPTPSPLPPTPKATEPQPSPTPIAVATVTHTPPPLTPQATQPPPSPAPPTPQATPPPPTPSAPAPTPAKPSADLPLAGCRVGTGLREQTAPILTRYKGQPALVSVAAYAQAGLHFAELEGWIRVLSAPNLEELELRAERAQREGLAYEGLGYGLETSESTPGAEWQDMVGSTQKARALADKYGKLLVMGPGFRLMSDNEDKYAPMAALSDVWIFQTQRLQVNPPGAAYRHDVERVVGLIRAGNPQIKIWAQITLPPDRDPDAEEWLAYRESIADLVDGTYVGVYSWSRMDNALLVSAVEQIFAGACGSAP